MPLTPRGRQELKARAHKLKPVVMVGGNGVTEAVLKEIDRALTDHELIKVRIAAEDRETRKALLAEVSNATDAELVQSIGGIVVLFRKNKDK